MGIAVALIVLMTITAILSMVWVIEVGHRLQELTDSYIPAYGSLARTNIRSLERALALRRMVIEKLQSPSSGDKSAVIRAAALESVPNDGPSMTFIKRIDSLMKNPPGEDWDGSWRLEQK